MRQCTNSCSQRVKDVAMDASPAMRYLSESGQWPPTLEVFAAELLVVFCLSRQCLAKPWNAFKDQAINGLYVCWAKSSRHLARTRQLAVAWSQPQKGLYERGPARLGRFTEF